MNIYLDCEFNSYQGELISLACVSEDGKEFYEVLPFSHMAIDPWVADNVLPILGKSPIGRNAFCSKLQMYLAQFNSVHIIADWPDDVAYFCQSLIIGPGARIDTPPITFEIVRDDAPSEQPHNALADAHGIRKFLMNKRQQDMLDDNSPYSR
jgi:hypothetical protein